MYSVKRERERKRKKLHFLVPSLSLVSYFAPLGETIVRGDFNAGFTSCARSLRSSTPPPTIRTPSSILLFLSFLYILLFLLSPNEKSTFSEQKKIGCGDNCAFEEFQNFTSLLSVRIDFYESISFHFDNQTRNLGDYYYALNGK